MVVSFAHSMLEVLGRRSLSSLLAVVCWSLAATEFYSYGTTTTTGTETTTWSFAAGASPKKIRFAPDPPRTEEVFDLPMLEEAAGQAPGKAMEHDEIVTASDYIIPGRLDDDGEPLSLSQVSRWQAFSPLFQGAIDQMRANDDYKTLTPAEAEELMEECKEQGRAYGKDLLLRQKKATRIEKKQQQQISARRRSCSPPRREENHGRRAEDRRSVAEARRIFKERHIDPIFGLGLVPPSDGEPAYTLGPRSDGSDLLWAQRPHEVEKDLEMIGLEELEGMEVQVPFPGPEEVLPQEECEKLWGGRSSCERL
ncbi:unnamed protein product [Amoebophrya sp. A120]|nr:unnamed protein product [Amoebophrya sp. A120]|eukprot:GSA120T00025828001.1